jgi:predicted nuclease of predicted toxin-antitoxin system
VARLADIFASSSHVQFHDLIEADDSEIWECAKNLDFCIVMQDADFAERSRLYGASPKVIWLRCGNIPTSSVERLLRSGSVTIHEFMDNMDNVLLDCLELY